MDALEYMTSISDELDLFWSEETMLQLLSYFISNRLDPKVFDNFCIFVKQQALEQLEAD